MTGNGTFSITIPPGKTSGIVSIKHTYAFGKQGSSTEYSNISKSTSGDNTYDYYITVDLAGL